MPEYRFTLRQIAEITGKSNTALFGFIKENSDFIKAHSQKNGRFIKYDDEALQAFIKRFCKYNPQVDNEARALIPPDTAQESAETPSKEVDEAKAVEAQASVVEAFEAQIAALKRERDELTAKLEARERDCADWRTQAGQALDALSKEQARVERLEERLAGYLPAPTAESETQTAKAPSRKLTLGERISVLFGRTPPTK